MKLATNEVAGYRDSDHELVAVNFETSTKPYYYWVPREWAVHVGDELIVRTPSALAAHVRIVALGKPFDPESPGHGHKCAVRVHKRHTEKTKPRSAADIEKIHTIDIDEALARFDTAVTDAGAPVFLDMKFVGPSVIRDGIQQLEFYRSQVAEAMRVPPELLGSGRTVTGRITMPYPSLQDSIPKEHAMISLETPTFLNGKDIKNYSDAELFEIIRRDEAEIKNLMGIESKPKALKDRINELQAGIDALVAFMDAR